MLVYSLVQSFDRHVCNRIFIKPWNSSLINFFTELKSLTEYVSLIYCHSRLLVQCYYESILIICFSGHWLSTDVRFSTFSLLALVLGKSHHCLGLFSLDAFALFIRIGCFWRYFNRLFLLTTICSFQFDYRVLWICSILSFLPLSGILGI